MQALLLVLLAITAGFTASGIAANLYRLSGVEAKTSAERTLRLAVMVVAGPSVIFENAVRGLLTKQWTSFTFWLATVAVAYWSLALGLLVVELAQVLPD
jgi:hypothetical protein